MEKSLISVFIRLKNKRRIKAVLDEIIQNEKDFDAVRKIDAVLLPSHMKLLQMSIKKEVPFYFKFMLTC